MQEAGKALKRMAIWAAVIAAYVLLLLVEWMIRPLPRSVISTLGLPALAIYLIYHFRSCIAERDGLKRCLLIVAWLIFLFLCIREIKYNVSPNEERFGRFLWYLYYIPVLLIPLFSFYASLLINTKSRFFPNRKWLWAGGISAFLLVLVLTNDLHQQVFVFHDQFYNWSADYRHGWGYYAIWAWQYILYLTSLLVMMKRCRLSTSRKALWVPIIPMVVGGLHMVQIVFGYAIAYHGRILIQFPETVCFMVAFFWEACIQIGLIPSNENYGKLFRMLSIPVWITSESGEAIYQSQISQTLTEAYVRINGDIPLDKDTILHGRKIPGGYGIWQEDISEINAAQEKLEDLREQLQEESALIQLENKRKEERAHIEQQNELYDRIAVMTRSQLKKISELAGQALAQTTGERTDEKTASLICVYGAYLKRMSNLMLLADETNQIEAGELYLAISESMRYLERTGVVCTLGKNVELVCCSERMIAAYRIFECLLEENLGVLKGIFVTFEKKEGWYLRMVLEGAKKMLPKQALEEMSGPDIPVLSEWEDDILYVKVMLREGGDF